MAVSYQSCRSQSRSFAAQEAACVSGWEAGDDVRLILLLCDQTQPLRQIAAVACFAVSLCG